VDNDKLIVRDDINFLEYPNWTVAERDGVKELIIKKENGIYKISTTADSLPNRFDKAVLYFLLSGLESDSSEITTTRYKLAKSIFYKTDKVGKIHYNRIMLSLKRWTSIFIEFNGIFYEGNNYTQRYFHIIDDVVLNEKTRELYIKFNQQYIRQLRESNFCKLIDFYEYRKLTKPVTARLFEILTKTFKDRDIWQIHIIKLAEKLTLEKRQDCNTYYPSDVVIKIETATKEIYKETDLKVKLEYDNNTHICTFIKLQDSQEEMDAAFCGFDFFGASFADRSRDLREQFGRFSFRLFHIFRDSFFSEIQIFRSAAVFKRLLLVFFGRVRFCFDVQRNRRHNAGAHFPD